VFFFSFFFGHNFWIQEMSTLTQPTATQKPAPVATKIPSSSTRKPLFYTYHGPSLTPTKNHLLSANLSPLSLRLCLPFPSHPDPHPTRPHQALNPTQSIPSTCTLLAALIAELLHPNLNPHFIQPLQIRISQTTRRQKSRPMTLLDFLLLGQDHHRRLCHQ